MKKRLFALLLSIALLFSAVVTPVSAERANNFSVKVCDTTATAGDDRVAVDIVLEDNPGIAGFSFCVNYDMEKLVLVESEINIEDGYKVVAQPTGYGVNLAWTGPSEYSQDGKIATLYFNVPKDITASDANIEIVYRAGYDSFYDSHESDIAVSTENGKISIAALQEKDKPSVNIGGVSANFGATDIVVPITVKNNPGFSGFSFCVNYDTSRLVLEDTKILLEDGYKVIGHPEGYVVNIAWTSTEAYTQDGTIAELHFSLKDNANSGKAYINTAFREGYDSFYSFDNGTEQDIAFDAFNGYVDVNNHHYAYTVVFKDWDGTVISTKNYHYGDPVTAPSNPTRDADNTYTYTFKGWDKTVANCAGDATYTAQYTATYKDYTVTFKNWDGTVLSTKTYHWGDAIVEPATPIKPADNVATYAFAGWDKEVVNCAGNATYMAQYISTYKNYTVVFKDWDGTVISTKNYHYGDPVTAPSNPTRDADNTYTYTFKGWDKDVENCAGDATYTAQYTATYKDYTVTFKNWDGTVLSTKIYHWGDTVAEPSTPTKPADNVATYAFAGWDKEVVNCVGDATYTATFTSTNLSYTIVFKNWDGTVLSSKTYHYGDKVKVPTTPTRAADNTYTYTFKGWDKSVVNCAGNATYTAIYTPVHIEYTVIFKDWNGNEISNQAYHYGDTIVAPSNPVRPADNTFIYVFAGWDKTVAACEGDTVFIATYRATFIEYTITFKNWDGTIISANKYHFGDAVVEPDAPVRASDGVYNYTFVSWDKGVSICLGNETYTAVFASTSCTYSIGGTVVSYLTDGEVTIELFKDGQATAIDTLTLTGKNGIATEYSFSNVASASYILKVSKANHVTRTYEVTIGSTDVTQVVKICPKGDVTGDGVVNIKDFQRLLRHVNKTNPLEGYALACGDVTGDGVCNIKDFQRLLRHVNKTNPLF